jgi:probable HAF family extracellular repeat protein
MNVNSFPLRLGLTLLAALAVAKGQSAQGTPTSAPPHKKYKVIVLPPDGGPDSFIAGYLFYAPMNNAGAVGIAGDMSAGAGYNSYIWSNDKQTDLQALPQLPTLTGTATYINWLNQSGMAAGYATRTDLSTGASVDNAVLWTPDGHIFDLDSHTGTQSHAVWINDFGLVSGWVENGTKDSCSFGTGEQTRAVIWLFGAMRPLGTLGGLQSYGEFTNDLGQVSGHAETGTAANTYTQCPPYDPFIWQNGKLIDINPGNFGGAEGGTNFLSNQGQAVGFGTEAGEIVAHAFSWQNGQLTELDKTGTLGGSLNSAYTANTLGHVVGVSSASDDSYFHAVLWANGKFDDLGSLSGDGCSEPFSINAHDQIVGISAVCNFSVTHAALWEHGELLDLNTLIPAGSGLELTAAGWITDAGEIGAQAIETATGDYRAVLLVPDGDCAEAPAAKSSVAESVTASAALTSQTTEAARAMIRNMVVFGPRADALQPSLLRPHRPAPPLPQRRK